MALVLVAVLVGAGALIYQAGVTQGLAASGNLAAPGVTAPNGGATGTLPYPYYAPFWRPWGWGFGFFPFGFIFPLLFFFLIFSLIRGLFFRGYRGWGYRHGPYGGYDPNEVPPAVQEWHRKMHERGDQPTGPEQPR